MGRAHSARVYIFPLCIIENTSTSPLYSPFSPGLRTEFVARSDTTGDPKRTSQIVYGCSFGALKLCERCTVNRYTVSIFLCYRDILGIGDELEVGGLIEHS